MRSSVHQAQRRASGQSFEDELEAACRFYRHHEFDGNRYLAGKEELLFGGRLVRRLMVQEQYQGTIPLHRASLLNGRPLEPAGIITRSHPKAVGTPGRMRYGPKGSVDFVGGFRATVPPGVTAMHPIAFDAKVRRGVNTFVVDEDELHQLWFLEEWDTSGALAFYLVFDGVKCFAVNDFLALAAKRTVRLADFAVLEPSTELSRPRWDFLELARRMVA